jgi:hypothetical protein
MAEQSKKPRVLHTLHLPPNSIILGKVFIIMTLRAYAKINIGLNVLGKRSDGYHDLETVFHEIDCFDEIELKQHDKVAMTADSILVPVDASNLCMSAAHLLQKEIHIQQGVMIHLKKNIPIGAGLGGGSSDAAAVLCGLNRLANAWSTDRVGCPVFHRWRYCIRHGKRRGSGTFFSYDAILDRCCYTSHSYFYGVGLQSSCSASQWKRNRIACQACQTNIQSSKIGLNSSK